MKRFTLKRITAFALALIMTLSLCPISAFAAGTLSGSANVSEGGVAFFTDLNGSILSSDSSVQSCGGPEGFRVYVVAGAAQSKTIYLAAPTWDTFTVTKGGVDVTPSPLSDTWTNGDGYDCYVYKLDGEKDGDIVEYEVTRYNDTIKVVFDFTPILVHGGYCMEWGVGLFDELNGDTLICGDDVHGSNIMCQGMTSKKMYLTTFVDRDLTVKDENGQSVALNQVGVTTFDVNSGTETRFAKVYEMTALQPNVGNEHVYTVTTSYDPSVTTDDESFPLTFDFSPLYTSSGDTMGARGVMVFTEKNGTEFSCDRSNAVQWGTDSGEHMYFAFGDSVSSRTVYMAVGQWDTLLVNNVEQTNKVGVWVNEDGHSFNVYKVDIPKPAGGGAEDYTVTRAWTWYDEANQVEVNESESLTMTFDFSTRLTGELNNAERGVMLFSKLNGTTLGYDEDVRIDGYDGAADISVVGKTAQTMYLGFAVHNEFTVENGGKSADMTYVGLWSDPDWDDNLYRIYEVEVNKPADGSPVVYDVTNAWWNWENGVPSKHVEDVPLTFEFATKYTDDGNGFIGARGVMIFNDKNGTEFSCDTSAISQWGNATGEYIYVVCEEASSYTVYLALNRWDTLLVNGVAQTNKAGVWTNYDGNLCNVYELTVPKPTTGKTVDYTITRAWTWYDEANQVEVNDSEDFTLTFDFAPSFDGDIEIGFWNIVIFNELNGNTLSCDMSSVAAWGDQNGQHAYLAYGDNTSNRKVYLATDMGSKLTVKNGTADVPMTYIGTYAFENPDGKFFFKTYEVPVNAPANGTAVDYTVTREWTWWENNQPVSDSISIPMTFDFTPILTGKIEMGAENVLLFTDLNGTELTCDLDSAMQWGDENGEHMSVMYGDTTNAQKIYLATSPRNTLTVENGTSPVAIKQVGMSTFKADDGSDWLCKVYEVPVSAPTNGKTVDFTVTNHSVWWDDNGTPDDGSDDVPVPRDSTFTLTADFSTVLTGDIVWGNWDVAIFTEMNGSALSCNEPIAQWWDTLYVACGNEPSQTVYLTIASYSDFTLTPQNGGAVINKGDMELVGKWRDEWGNLKEVYALTVQNPKNDSKSVSFDAKRSWTWYDTKGNNDPSDDELINQEMNFVLTFDFAPILEGEPYNGMGGVDFFSSLKNNTLRGDNSLLGLGNSQMVACGGADEKTIYLAVYANSDLSVSEYSTLNNVDIERVGTWTTTNDEGGFKNPFKVYSLTVKNPGLDMNSVASFFVNREWEYYDDKGTYDDASDDEIIPYKDSFPLNFDFYLRPGVEVPPLMFNGLRIYGICEDGQLGYQHMYEYDEMAYNPTMNLVQVPGRPNHDHSIYLVSAKALTLKENTVGATLSVYKEASVVDGYTAYCLTMPAKNAGQFAVKVSDGTNDTTFNFWFDSVSYQRTSFYTTSDLNYENRLTCDGLSIEWLETGDPNEDHFYLKVPYAAGKAKDLYIVPNDADISSVEVYGGSWSANCTFEKHPSAYKLSVPASSESGNVVLRFYKLDNEGNPFIFGAVDLVFEPQMEVKVDDTSVGEAEQAVGEVIADNIDEAITDGSVKIAEEYEKEEVVQLQKDDKLELVPEQAMGCDEKDKKHIDKAVEEAGGTVSGTTIQYFDITVVLKHKESGKTVAQVTDTKKDITITIELSPDMQAAARNGKIIRVLRVHNGIAEFLEAVLNAEKTMISFASSEFSSYALMATGVTVNGTITSYLSETDDVTVELFAEGSATADYSTTVKGNETTYTLGDVAEGTYTMKVSKANHVTREYTVTVGDTDVTQDAKIHPKGDVDGNGSVNILDVNRANLHYKNKSLLPDYEKLCADVDGNGSVNILDVNRLNLHYKNKTLLW